MEAKPQFHGSDTAAVAAFYHVPVDEIVCFGANVNPLGLSKNLKKDLAAFSSYLYCAFYLLDNHVVHPVYHTDVTLE